MQDALACYTHLVARQGPKSMHVVFALQQLPQLVRSPLRECVLHLDAAAQALHILLCVRASHALEAPRGCLDVGEAHGLKESDVCGSEMNEMSGGEQRRALAATVAVPSWALSSALRLGLA